MRIATLILLLAMAFAAQAEQAKPAPVPPILVSPPDDQFDAACLDPDDDGIALQWVGSENPYPVAFYLEIRRYADRDWRPWLKTYARPPFVLRTVNPLTHGAVFAWRVWAVDRTGEAQPYAVPSPWFHFCTVDE